MTNKLTLNDIRLRLSSTDIECVEDYYKSPHLNLNFKCKGGHNFKASWYEIQKFIESKPPQCPLCKHKDRMEEKRIQHKEIIPPIGSSSKVVEKFIRNKRWFVKIDPPFNGKPVLAYAIYVWLLGNPGFSDLPIGYDVHHLDGDCLNDDISNLVIMHKFHHAAYHLKQRDTKTGIKLRPGYIDDQIEIKRTQYFPTKEPGIYQSRPGRYRL